YQRQWTDGSGRRLGHSHDHRPDANRHGIALADRGDIGPDHRDLLPEERVLMLPLSKKGQALVEFALMFPTLFFLLALTVDLFRVDWVTTTVAEAARQGARQAVANADPYDNPFGAASGSCSGTTQVNSANGSGCLTSSRVYQTVLSVLGGF